MAQYGKLKLQEVLNYLINNPDKWDQDQGLEAGNYNSDRPLCFIGTALKMTGGLAYDEDDDLNTFQKRFGVDASDASYIWMHNRTLEEIAARLEISMVDKDIYEVEYLDKVKRGLTSKQATDMSQKLEDLGIEFKVFRIERVEVEY